MHSGMTEYISTAEASELAGYGETYIRRLVRQGKLKADKKGGQYWVDRDSLVAYLEMVKTMGSQRFNWRRKQRYAPTQ